MVNKKKKPKAKNLRLRIFRNYFKSIKYYFKSILYILFINYAIFFLINHFLKTPFLLFSSNISSSGLMFNIIYYGTFLFLFSVFKVVVYLNIMYVMKTNGLNDIKELIILTIKSYVPTVGIALLFVFLSLFFTALLILPGLLFFFYCFFSIHYYLIGDPNNSIASFELKGIAGLEKSFHLVVDNFFRIIIITSAIIATAWGIDSFLRILLVEANIVLSKFVLTALRLSIYDLIIIYSCFIFIKLLNLQKELAEEQNNVNLQEQTMLNAISVNRFSSKKR